MLTDFLWPQIVTVLILWIEATVLSYLKHTQPQVKQIVLYYRQDFYLKTKTLSFEIKRASFIALNTFNLKNKVFLKLWSNHSKWSYILNKAIKNIIGLLTIKNNSFIYDPLNNISHVNFVEYKSISWINRNEFWINLLILTTQKHPTLKMERNKELVHYWNQAQSTNAAHSQLLEQW